MCIRDSAQLVVPRSFVKPLAQGLVSPLAFQHIRQHHRLLLKEFLNIHLALFSDPPLKIVTNPDPFL
jgi:hypothetical protein